MKYRVEYMNRKEYEVFMMGGYVIANTVEVEAPTKELAVAIAKALIPGEMVFNENYVPTVEELEREKLEREMRIAEEVRKKEERKEWEKAHPEIMEERKRKAKIAKCKREIKKAEEEIERLRKLVARENAKLTKLEG